MNLTCIRCPLGCRMTIEKKDDEFIVTGNSCPKGKEYAISEMTAPTRMITSSVPVRGGKHDKMVAVKTNQPIAKDLIFKAVETLNGVVATAPINEGDVIVKNLLGTGVDFIATREIE